jgi:hypothetical protein
VSSLISHCQNTKTHTQVKTIPEDFFVEEDELSRGNFLQPCLRALVRNVRDFCRKQGTGQEGPEEQQQQQQGVVVDLEEDEEDEEDQQGRSSAAVTAADVAQDLGRYVDRFAALMERRFRGLELGRAVAAAAAAAAKGQDEEEEEDEDGPVVVPWEEVSRALGEIDEGRRGAALSTIQE